MYIFVLISGLSICILSTKIYFACNPEQEKEIHIELDTIKIETPLNSHKMKLD